MEPSGNEYIAPAEIATMQAAIHAPLLTWAAVHGNLCLALRHPENTGPSTQLVVQFLDLLGEWLVENKMLSRDQLDLSKRQESPHRPPPIPVGSELIRRKQRRR